ncbi:MAG: DNA adenine methylase [Treponemataceae bacterium]|nr:DNA adenine methylase [Treponemataceae bacterium]
MSVSENPDFLSTQIITYIGNKRALIGLIQDEIVRIKKEAGLRFCSLADLFSGSGVVARMMKAHASHLLVNDLEQYSYLVNSCYLTNKSSFDQTEYMRLKTSIEEECRLHKRYGIISEMYAPRDENCISPEDRVFYTKENALLIDTYRALIDELVKDGEMRKFFLAPLITEASVHTNTSGVFKGFYKDKTGRGCYGGSGKNALSRILGRIELKQPVLSRFECPFEVLKCDAVTLSHELAETDIVYLDPPYNQHPYGSNYFMLNTIIENKITAPVSKVSGIVSGWNRSVFNKKEAALSSLEEIVSSLKARYIIISYNSEGFVSYDEMVSMLGKYGELSTREIPYNTFRGSRNLSGRSIHVSEYLFTIKKY